MFTSRINSLDVCTTWNFHFWNSFVRKSFGNFDLCEEIFSSCFYLRSRAFRNHLAANKASLRSKSQAKQPQSYENTKTTPAKKLKFKISKSSPNNESSRYSSETHLLLWSSNLVSAALSLHYLFQLLSMMKALSATTANRVKNEMPKINSLNWPLYLHFTTTKTTTSTCWQRTVVWERFKLAD